MGRMTIFDSNNNNFQAAGLLLALNAVAHGTTAAMYSRHSIAGFTFGSMYVFGSQGAYFLEQWLERNGYAPFHENSTFAKGMKVAIAFFAGIALATTVCGRVGSSVTFSAGLNLTGTMLATTAILATFVSSHDQAKKVILGTSFLNALRG